MDTLSYYKAQSSFTNPGDLQNQYEVLPATADELATVVDGLLLDYREISRYPIPNERLLSMHARTAEALLEYVLSWNKDPLTESRPMQERFLAGTCDYANLFVSMARHVGIPARKRVGYADGQSCERPEYFDEADKQWKSLDISGMYPGPFVPAAQVWLGCRSGELDPNDFTSGLDDKGRTLDKGWSMVIANLLLDMAGMNKREMLEWDRYGWSLRPIDEFSDRALETLDHAAELLLAGDPELESTISLYNTEEGIQVPRVVRCFPPLTPSHKAEVPV